MDNEKPNKLDAIGGRKFILAVLTMAALVAVGVLAPTALTAELVVGLLGVIGAYSGSNAVLSALSLKKSSGGQIEAAPQEGLSEEMLAMAKADIEQKMSEIETKVAEISQAKTEQEQTIAQVIEILKQQNSAITALTAKQ